MLEGLKEFLRRIGLNRYKHLTRDMPTDAVGRLRHMLSGARDTFTFPPAPCEWLCKRGIRRIHFTCLTCWVRKLHFKKRGWKELKWYSKVYMANRPPVGSRGAVPIQTLTVTSSGKVALPIYYTNYGLFIPRGKQRPWDWFRLFIVKYLLCLAERIAEW